MLGYHVFKGAKAKLNCYAVTLLVLLFVSATAQAVQTVGQKLEREHSVSQTFSVYITMRDGVRIAADIHLPSNLKKGEKIPALLYQTIYLRSHRTPKSESPKIGNQADWNIAPKLNHDPTRTIDFQALENGYAIIKTDVRGTGASFGTRSSPLPPEEIQDSSEIIDWIVAQDWSNGNVGSFGVSYMGMTAGMAMTVKHPALKAVVIGWSGIYDEYKTAMQPYGLVQPGTTCTWSKYLENLWSNNWKATGKSIMPVDGDEGAILLEQALEEHTKNELVCDLLSDVTFSDDVIGKDKLSIQSFSQKDFKQEIEASGTAILTLASWYDTGAVDAHFVRQVDFSNDQKIFLTGGQHGARYHSSPYVVDDKPMGPIPTSEVTWGKAITFFDYYLKGIKNGYNTWPAVTYWNLGEEAFKNSGPWPLENTNYVRFYLKEGKTLSTTKSTKATSFDEYKVDFSATTGRASRWWTGLGTPMLNLADRRKADEKLLVYTSEPLENDMQITGWPIVSLNISSTHSDGAFIAYLEDVDETGKSTYVNEGGLRALHRKVIENPVAGLPVPYHSFKKEDAMPLKVGEIATIQFEMIPTSVKIARGHRIRIAIAGADKDNFARIPKEGEPIIRVYHSRSRPSYVELPVIKD